MNYANANHIKTFEIKLALWLAPLFSPQGDVGSNFIVAKMVTFKRPNWLNLNLIFIFIFPYFAFKNYIITSKFQL
jgi:hypothetical protein